MSTLKKTTPNLLEVAKKQMSKFIDKISVPTEIAENETGLYHVVIVEANFNQAQLEATYKAKVQKYDDRSWLVVKDRLKQIGHTSVYVIHDPTIKAEDKPKENKKAKDGKGTGADAGADANKGAGADAGDNGDDAETPQEKRQALIDRAKELGYEGALNAKNTTFEEFIKNAETNGAGADADGDGEE